MARNLREQGYSPDYIRARVMQELNADAERRKEIAEETKAYKTEIKKLIKETEKKALKDGDLLIANAGTMAWNDDLQMWEEHGVSLKEDNTLSQLKQAFREQTRDALKNFTRSTGSLYSGYDKIDNKFMKELDLATIKIASGAFSQDQALRDCVKRLSVDGVAIKYPSGRKYHIDTAARMALRTATSQLAGKITESNLAKTQTDLVYVDAHAGSRPEHALWQGKVYVYNKAKADKYPQYADFYDSTDYGSITGLKGVNCSHNFYPYWEGDPIPEYKEPEPVMINGKEYTYYEATQEQRRQERQIRQSRRELETLKAVSASPEEIQKAQAKLSKQLGDYKQFSFSAGIRAKTERLPIFTETPKESIIIHRNKLKAGIYPTSDEKIQELINGPLSGVRFSAEITYNGRLKTPGRTDMVISPLGQVTVIRCMIGKQYKPGDADIMDSILHEELEIRIARNRSERFRKMAKGGNDTIHPYINSVIDKFFAAKGIER